MFSDFVNSNIVYNPDDVDHVIDLVMSRENTKKNNKGIAYYNTPCSFDIETSSFYDKNDNKTACMYIWMLGINGAVIVGRTWDEFSAVVETIVEKLDLHEKKRLIIYVHNLAYEFQFICKRFEWLTVFALADRKPVYAVTTSGIEFRCSYILSGYSLAKLADNLQTHTISKMVGDLDYSKMRNSITPISDLEMGYCVNDVKIVMAYIDECIKNDGSIIKIPLTKTGYVRKFVRNRCFYDKENKWKRLRYSNFIKGLSITIDEYMQLKRAFQGGFTHANPFYSGKVIDNVSSYDFTSSYPTVMIAEKFPMSKGELVDISTMSKDDFEKNLKSYCCVFDVAIEKIYPKVWYDNYLSSSRCSKVLKPQINNGRIISAEYLETTMTEQDYYIMKEFYSWDSFHILSFRRYKKGYLPTDFVRAIIELYENKTILKGVKGKEVEYMQSKAMLNACYGMCVTDIVRDEAIFTDHWLSADEKECIDIQEKIEKYNNDNSRFLSYAWGVWVTAYARRNLFTGIIECAEDYIYADTDSIKIINADKHQDYINRYNDDIIKKLEKALEFHGIDIAKIKPKTIKGIEKPLGIWDYEGTYKHFKTLGAKRYIVEQADGTYNITVAGLAKRSCLPYLENTYENIFDAFTHNLYIPADYTGKNTHTYIDDVRVGELTDYMGNTAKYNELSCVHLEPADYSLSLSYEYIRFLLNIQDVDF